MTTRKQRIQKKHKSNKTGKVVSKHKRGGNTDPVYGSSFGQVQPPAYQPSASLGNKPYQLPMSPSTQQPTPSYQLLMPPSTQQSMFSSQQPTPGTGARFEERVEGWGANADSVADAAYNKVGSAFDTVAQTPVVSRIAQGSSQAASNVSSAFSTASNTVSSQAPGWSNWFTGKASNSYSKLKKILGMSGGKYRKTKRGKRGGNYIPNSTFSNYGPISGMNTAQPQSWMPVSQPKGWFGGKKTRKMTKKSRKKHTKK